MSRKLERCVIVGGAGGVGRMFSSLLAGSGVEVFVVDLTPPDADLPFERCDITAPTPQATVAIKTADMVLLALPEGAALRAVKSVGTQMKPDALLAHTLSVQSPIATEVEASGLTLEMVGLNPMFAPSLSIIGRPVAAIVQNDGPLAEELLQLLSDWGGHVVRLDAQEHDRLVAVMQALTHATVLTFGLALADLNVDIKKLSSLAPPPHATLLALLARISSGTPEVYWDVQSANDYAPAVRAALAGAVERLNEVTRDESAFIDVLREGREVLGHELATYQNHCALLFNSTVSQPSRSTREE